MKYVVKKTKEKYNDYGHVIYNEEVNIEIEVPDNIPISDFVKVVENSLK